MRLYRGMKEGKGSVPACFFFVFFFFGGGEVLECMEHSLTCTCCYLCIGQLHMEHPLGPDLEVATEAVSPSEKLYRMVNSLAEKMQSFSKTSGNADSVTEEMADILSSWNRDFVKLKSHEHALLSERIANTPGVLNSFLSLADTLLPGKNCTACIIMLYVCMKCHLIKSGGSCLGIPIVYVSGLTNQHSG